MMPRVTLEQVASALRSMPTQSEPTQLNSAVADSPLFWLACRLGLVNWKVEGSTPLCWRTEKGLSWGLRHPVAHGGGNHKQVFVADMLRERLEQAGFTCYVAPVSGWNLDFVAWKGEPCA